jgi:hypothetical protein
MRLQFISMMLCAVSPALLAQSPANPFARFIGEWTLKDDAWSQNWDGATENIKIPNHHTTCRAINTDAAEGPHPLGLQSGQERSAPPVQLRRAADRHG